MESVDNKERKLILLNYDRVGKCPNYEEYLHKFEVCEKICRGVTIDKHCLFLCSGGLSAKGEEFEKEGLLKYARVRVIRIKK